MLEFGGLSHCVDTDRTDDDGFPRPVSPHDPARDVCRDHVRAGRDGHGGYAARYLRWPAGSEQRKAEYDALRSGEAPSDDQFAGYRVDKADAPAVDIQQAGGAFQRLTFAVVVLLGALGAVALLGFLSLAVILAQVVALVLLGFAPVALVIGIFPGAGHQFFRGWLIKLATAVFIKALYSLVIAIVVAVSAALTAATGSLGFLFAFGLQTIFFWAIFIYRKQITARLVNATTGAAQPALPRMTVVQKGAQAATRPITALVGAARRGDDAGDRRQESALAGGAPADVAARRPEAATPASSAPSIVARATGAHPHGDGPSPRTTAGGPARGNGAGVNGTRHAIGHVQPAPAASAGRARRRRVRGDHAARGARGRDAPGSRAARARPRWPLGDGHRDG